MDERIYLPYTPHIIVYHHRTSGQKFKQQESGGRMWCRGYGGMLFTGLLLMSCPACFLTEPGITSPGVVLPTMNCAFSYQWLIKKVHCRLACLQHNLIKVFFFLFFLNWGSLFCDDYSLYQDEIKLASAVAMEMNGYFKRPNQLHLSTVA